MHDYDDYDQPAEPTPPPSRVRRRTQKSRWPTPLVVLSGLVAVWLLACVVIWSWAALARQVIADAPTPGPSFIVVTDPIDEPPTPEPTLFLVEPTVELTPTIPVGPGGTIVIGTSVRVFGTGNDGLRLRQQPTITAPVNYLGIDFEVFTVNEGPQTADGFTWWFLVAPDDNTRNGWAVENYLQVVSGP